MPRKRKPSIQVELVTVHVVVTASIMLALAIVIGFSFGLVGPIIACVTAFIPLWINASQIRVWRRWPSQVLLFINTLLQASLLIWICRESNANPDPLNGVSLMMAGLFGIPIMCPAWVLAALLQFFLAKRL